MARMTPAHVEMLGDSGVTRASLGVQSFDPLVQKTVMMELAPVLTGLALAGRVGANIAAELGTMRVTEQVDALETLSFDPVAYLVVPRILAAVIMFPVVVGVAMFVGLGAGWAASLSHLARCVLLRVQPVGISCRSARLHLADLRTNA